MQSAARCWLSQLGAWCWSYLFQGLKSCTDLVEVMNNIIPMNVWHSRWWFQLFFIFTPEIGEDEPNFDEQYFFSDGVETTNYSVVFFLFVCWFCWVENGWKGKQGEMDWLPIAFWHCFSWGRFVEFLDVENKMANHKNTSWLQRKVILKNCCVLPTSNRFTWVAQPQFYSCTWRIKFLNPTSNVTMHHET